MAVSMASPKMAWRSLTIERMADFASWALGDGCPRPCLKSHDMLYSSDRAMAVERVPAGAEATATLERHMFKACSENGNRRVGTLRVLGGGEALAAAVRTVRCMVPMTPLWYKKEAGRVIVSPVCSERWRGSLMAI